jgi:cytosine/adenosine deaminase-related metal-dependent hydrolase
MNAKSGSRAFSTMMKTMQRARLVGLFLPVLFAALGFGQTTPVALTGTVLTPSGSIENGTVLFRDGKILAVGEHVALPANARVIATHGIVVPGFIDLHNHLTWNVFPRWKPMEEFGSRYDWQQKPIYKVLMDTPHRELVAEGHECDMEWYAEVKAVSEGETSVVGGTKQNCGWRLARNLDLDPHTYPGIGGAAAGPVIYNVFPFQMSEEELASAKSALDHGGSLLIHVAEGAPHDASAAREFAMLKGRGLLRKGVSVIHGVALTPDDFQQMAAAGVGFLWSPRSNLELYGDTANVAAAKAAHVPMAIAPDWSPTGSDGTLAELNFAAAWNASQAAPVFTDRELVEMATSGAAQLVGMEHSLGSLAQGYAADILVLKPHGEREGKDAWWSVVHSDARDVELVTIGGEIVYADHSLVLEPGMDRAAVCDVPKQVAFGRSSGSRQSFESIEMRLDRALNEWGRRLAPLAECGQ